MTEREKAMEVPRNENGEWAYDFNGLPEILDKTKEPWTTVHEACAECPVKDVAEHTLDECGLYP